MNVVIRLLISTNMERTRFNVKRIIWTLLYKGGEWTVFFLKIIRETVGEM